jgi:hypothetical protein
MVPVREDMDFIHVRVPLQENAAGLPLFRPRFRLPLSAHSLKAVPYGYHLSAPLSAITTGFPLSAPLSVYRFQDHSPGAIPFGFHLSAPLSAITFSTAVGLPFGSAFSLPLSDHNFSVIPSAFTFRPRFRCPNFNLSQNLLKPVGAPPLPEKSMEE